MATTQRQRRAARRAPARPYRSVEPVTPNPAVDDTPKGLIFLVIAWLALSAFDWLDPWLGLPLTRAICPGIGCSPPVMVVAGWLLVAVPVALLAVARRVWSRARRPVALGYLALVVLLAAPGSGLVLERSVGSYLLVDGTRTDLIVSGARWAAVGALLSVAAIPVLHAVASFDRRQQRQILIVAVVTLHLGTLAGAVQTADADTRRATDVFAANAAGPGGGTLGRIGVDDRPGCAGILANELLLGGCLATVRAAYVTPTGDSVVHLAAVRFADGDEAQGVRNSLPVGTGQQGFSGEARHASTAAGDWVVLGTVRSPDGRAAGSAPGDTEPARLLRHLLYDAAERLR